VNVPRKTPSVPCVVRSRTKLIRMRGENCVDASVSVISRIANTIDTTVMIEVAMLLRMTCATPGSWCEGNRVLGIQALIPNCLFQRRQHRARGPQHHGDCHRPNEEAATKRIHRGTEEDRQALKHSDAPGPIQAPQGFHRLGPTSTNTS